MLNKEQGQNQQQSIDIGIEKHGVVTEVHCPFFTDGRTTYLREHRDYGEHEEAILNKELYFKSQVVRVIIYHGKARPICHLFDVATGKCQRKTDGNAQCHIV
ncbi:MAG: hypothetical protein Q8N62_03800 [Candidatus Omnitrophota bacterium]|nr:hypothetical protein [Candidatus Omnitrophota bacterium]